MSSFVVGNVIFADNAFGTLGAGLTVGGTALSFTAGMGARFPTVVAPQVLYCTLLNATNVLEEIQITAHAAGADSATIVRAQGGTSALVWNTGDRIEARVSATVLSTITAKNMWCGAQAAGSTANALLFTSDTPKASYRLGDEYIGVPSQANTTAVTVNFDSIGVLAVQRDGNGLQGGEFAANKGVRFTISASTACQMERINNAPINIGNGTRLTSYYKNTFTDFTTATYSPGFYFLDAEGFVNLQGEVSCVSTATVQGTIIATLPSSQGLFPTQGVQVFCGVSSNAFGYVTVDGTGNVRVGSMAGTAISLDQVRYYGNPAS